MKKNSKIYVAGHNGMVGSAIVRVLLNNGYHNLILKTREELDLINQQSVNIFFKEEHPMYVFVASARVGGIKANSDFKAEFLYENLMINSNIIHSSYQYNVKKLLFLGSSCIYPKNSPQPIKEEYLLDGELEPTNEGYALAKISGLKMCEYYRQQYNCDFISLIPTNLYGENDNFDTEQSHVISALIKKIVNAKIKGDKQIYIWGTGKPLREFLYVDDLAEACLFTMLNYSDKIHLNVGTGKDISILELTKLIIDIVGYEGEVLTDSTKPDGMFRKLLDVNKIKEIGWSAKTSFIEGLKKAISFYEKLLKSEKL